VAARIIVQVGLDDLLDTAGFNPYRNSPWSGIAALSMDDVLACSAPNPGRLIGGRFYPRHIHTARVAWLVRHWRGDGGDPIDVEVCTQSVTVHDGCHRIAAAIARGDARIHAEVSGDLDEALELGFPVAPFIAAFSAPDHRLRRTTDDHPHHPQPQPQDRARPRQSH
jgi:hypothetical protein